MKIGVDIRALIEARYSGVSEFSHNLLKEILKLDKKNKYKLFYNSAKDLSSHLPEFKQDNVEIVKTNNNIDKIVVTITIIFFFSSSINFII